MVHLYSYHTRIEDIQQEYSPERLKSQLEYIDQDHAKLTELEKACRCRMAELSKLEYIQYVEFRRSQESYPKSHIVFYVGLNTAAIVDGREIHVDSTENQRFYWETKKDAAKYAKELADKHSVELRDLSGKGGKPP
jgi:hypothetical protein